MTRTITVTGAEAIVRMLKAQGVKQVFGLCGHTVIGVLDAMSRSDVRFISVHHEGVAAHAADGFARRTGRAGVVLVHLGPGLTNAITGIANAMLDAVPMVVISGNIQSYYFGRNAHQETNLHADANQADALAPFTKRIWKVQKPEALVSSIEAAFRIAETGRKAPVLVDVAMDVFSLPVQIDADWTPPPLPQSPGLSRNDARKIMELVRAAKKPVLYLGPGAAMDGGPGAALALAERLNIPVAYELLGKGILPDDHPLNLGVTGFWGSPAANAACKEADVVLAIGAKFPELDTCSWAPGVVFSFPPAKLIHVIGDTDEIGRSYRPSLGCVADGAKALGALVEEAEGSPRKNQPKLPDHLQQIKDDFARKLIQMQRTDGVPVHPARAVADIGAALPKDAVLVGDTGWNKNGIGQQLKISNPRAFLAPGSFATMGFGPTAVLGAAMDGSGAPVVALVGDGAFLTNISVVLTAVEERIPIVWVVMNNSGYGSIAGLQKLGFGTQYGVRFDTSVMSFPKLAEALGALGARVEKADQIGKMLKDAIKARRPYILEIPTTNDPAPITGTWDVIDLYKRAADARASGFR